MRLKPKKPDRIVVGEIDEAPDCENSDDLLAKDGRKTINRLFRNYLDKNNLTATEVMHNFKELKRCMDHDSVVPGAVAKVATLQSKGREDITTNERRDQLFGFLNELAEKARKTEAMPLPMVRDAGLDGVIDVIEKSSKNGDFDYMVKVVLSRELVDNRSYFGNLSQTLEWAEPAQDERALDILDNFISDTLANATVLQDLNGDQRDLGSVAH